MKESQQKLANIFKHLCERRGREKNPMWREKLGWVDGCFQHFLENFSQKDKISKKKSLIFKKALKFCIRKLKLESIKLLKKSNTLMTLEKFNSSVKKISWTE